jgi:DNA-binding PadR family transcriptional regulator
LLSVPWKKELIQLSETADGKVSPAFKPHHAAVALMMIGREAPLGRYELCQNMSIGEGSVRTLLKRFTENGYIAPDGRQGQRLTSKGKTLFDQISNDIPSGLFLDVAPLVMFGKAFANLVKNKASEVTDGVRQRDEAIIQGGYGEAGATTLVYKNGSLLIPPGDYHVILQYESEGVLIIESLRPSDEDVIVIGSSNDPNLAREVSMAAVMTLFDED